MKKLSTKRENPFIPWLKKLKNKEIELHINSGQGKFDGDRTTYVGRMVLIEKELMVFEERQRHSGKNSAFIFPIDDIEKICVDADDIKIRSNVKIKEI